MSLVISTNKLFVLTQSPRLRKILDGDFDVQVLTPPTTMPYRCSLSSQSVQATLDAALAENPSLSAGWNPDMGRKAFVKQLLKKPNEVVRKRPKVHAELAMIMAMEKGEIDHVLPYIGVSKLCCTMCSIYIQAFNEVSNKNITTRGCHGKAYPGWFWPEIPSRDKELRRTFIKKVKQQLIVDFKEFRKHWMLHSDSTVGSGGPALSVDGTGMASGRSSMPSQ